MNWTFLQCDGQHGVCPDTRLSGKNDIIVTDGYRKNGVTTVMFKRPFNTLEAVSSELSKLNDDRDRHIYIYFSLIPTGLTGYGPR